MNMMTSCIAHKSKPIECSTTNLRTKIQETPPSQPLHLRCLGENGSLEEEGFNGAPLQGAIFITFQNQKQDSLEKKTYIISRYPVSNGIIQFPHKHPFFKGNDAGMHVASSSYSPPYLLILGKFI